MVKLLATWNGPGKVALEAAWRVSTEDVLTRLEKGLAAAEEDPSLVLIGRGSVPNADGNLELDASIMDGDDLSAGAVCSVQDILPVISVARLVKEKTPHVMLAGEGARRFAIENGFKPRNLLTPMACELYEYGSSEAIPAELLRRVHEGQITGTIEELMHGDTITMLGFSNDRLSGPRLVAASSTSGLMFKRPGRVGDSPIVGAGIYADSEAGAAGASGLGEAIWKACASYRIVEGMREGKSAQSSCEAVAREMRRRIPITNETPCVLFAIDRHGEHGAATTCGEFPFWVGVDGSTALEWAPKEEEASA